MVPPNGACQSDGLPGAFGAELIVDVEGPFLGPDESLTDLEAMPQHD